MKIKTLNIVFGMVLLLSAGLTFRAQGQTNFGFRAGLNVSNVSFENLPNKSERFGYHIGAFAELPIVADFMSIQPELSYGVKGAAYKPLNDRQTLNLTYLYLLIPVACKLSSIDVQVGPFASFLISTPDFTVFEDDMIIVDAFKKYDLGLTAGLSYNFNHWLIGIRYNQGLVAIAKDNAHTILGNGQNAVGQVSLGYRFKSR